MEQTISQRMELYAQMISCGQNLCDWELDPSLQLVRTTSQDAQLFLNYLLADSIHDALLAYIQRATANPMILSGSVGLNWIVSPEIVEGVTCRVHLIGPVFTSDMSTAVLEKELYRRHQPRALIDLFVEKVRQIPVVPLTVWANYGLMLHFCVTGARLEISDYLYSGQQALRQTREEPITTSGGTWYAEQIAMEMVEKGQTDYKKALTVLGNVSGSASIQGIASLRQCKNYIISFITLVTRAAIRGGLDPQTAYSIGEIYLANAEDATTTAELAQLHSTMYDDFIQRVHKVRTADNISAAVHRCCDYIQLHFSEKITMEVLSAQAGYAEYYLAQKFKKETGMTVSQYVRQKRVERAKLLLRSSD